MEEPNNGEPFCGVVSDIPKSKKEIYYRGKILFRNNCAQCHSQDMRQEVTAPALFETFNYWVPDTAKFLMYINDSEFYLSSGQDDRILQLHNKFGFGLNSHSNNFTLVELKDLIYFIEEKSK